MAPTNHVHLTKRPGRAVRLWILATPLTLSSIAIGVASSVVVMDYEDLYEPADGPLWSWRSMKWYHRLAWIASGSRWLGLVVGMYLTFRATRETISWYRSRRRSP